MATYSITNSAGSVVATISVGTTTGTTFPIEIPGQGTSLYGEIIGKTQYHLLENFANSTQPANAVAGMNWYSTTTKSMSYYDGANFIPYGNATNTSVKFTMDATASNINMTATGTTTIFTSPSASNTYYPMGILIKPVGTPTATTAALINLQIAAAEDVLETISVRIPDATSYAYYAIQGTTKAVTSTTAPIKLEVTTAATGGTFSASVELYGVMV